MALTLTTSGILPTTDPLAPAAPVFNPLYGEDGYTWSAEQAERNALAREKQRTRLDKMDAAILDPAGFFAKNPFNPAFADDPEKAKRRVFVSAYLRHENGGAPLPMGADGHEMFRRKVAAARFDGRGAEDDDAFHAELVKAATTRRDTKEIARQIIVSASDDAMLPSGMATGFKAARDKVKTLPGYQPAMDADLMEAWAEQRAAVAEKIAPFREPLQDVWNEFSGKGNITGAAYTAWAQIPPENRRDFLEALALRAKALPDDQRETFWQNMRKVTEQAIGDFARQAGESATANARSLDYRTYAPGGVEIPLPAGVSNTELKDSRQAGEMEFRQKRNFAADVRQIFREDYDPLTSAFREGKPGFWEGVAYQTPGVTATSLSMAVPVVGPAAMAFSMEGAAYESTRARLLSQGMDVARASEIASGLAPLIAAPQFALEKVGFGIWSRKLPGFSNLMDNLGNRITNRVLRGAAKTAAIGTAETVIEIAQDTTQAVFQSLADDVPGVDWGSIAKEQWANSPEIFFTMLPLSILGAAGGLSREAQAAAFAQSTSLERRALGITDEASRAIDAAAKMGPASLNTAIENAMATRDPNGPDAVAAVQEMKAQQASQARAQQDLERLGYATPRLVQTAEGISVVDSVSGEEIGTAPDLSGALRIAKGHTVALDDLQADQVAALGTLMEAARAATEIDPASAVDVAFDETFDPEKASPDQARRYAAQVALLEQSEGGSGDIARSVLGTSETTFAQGMRTTINRIYRGGSVLTVFHETFHGLRRAAHARGALTRADEISLLRGLDSVLAGKRVKGGRELRFIPEGVTDDQISDTLLDEAVSEIAEMEVLRTRKGAGKGKLGVTRGIVSRNLTALAKLMPGVAGKFQAFLRAVRAHWGLSLSRAIALKAAERRGEFDAGNYQEFLDRLLGLDAQREHDDGVRAELNRILAMPEVDAEDDIPFSIGRATVTPSAETQVFPGDDGSPSVIGPAAFSIGAYHGTPHKVDKFSLDKIGTGEGAQAYGWGLYFADTKEVGEGYRNALVAKKATYPREVLDMLELSGFREQVSMGLNSSASEWLALHRGQPLEVLRNALKVPSKAQLAAFKEWTGKHWEKAWDWHDDWDSDVDISMTLYASAPDVERTEVGFTEGEIMAIWRAANETGNIYRVELDVEEDDLLDWDKSLSEQSEKVRDILEEEMKRIKSTAKSGQEAYMLLKFDKNRNESEASSRLREIGIPGIRYLDGNSRSDGKGSYNYVIFDESKIKITEENGQPVNLKETLTGSDAFSLGPADVPAIMEQSALSRVRDPRRRTHAMTRIARDFNSMRLQIDRLLALSGRKRSKAELRQEANAREDLRAEELIADVHRRFGSILADEDLVKIKSQPVHAFLADPKSPLRGRVMSKAAAIKAFPDRYALHRGGEYDGSEAVSRSVFGGTRMPDQAAQELFDHGLISEPTPDAMWEALLAEQNSVAKMKEALAKATEQIREAKAEAKREATEWLQTQGKDQETNFNPREEILRSLRMLDAILLAMPPEVRGKIGGYTQMARITTDKAKLSFLKDKLAKADAELETFLREEFGKEFEALMKKARPTKDNPGERPSGTIDPEAWEIFKMADAATHWKFREAEAEATKWESLADHEDTTPEEAQKYSAMAQVIRLCQNWEGADAARREMAVMELDSIYYGGLLKLRQTLSARNERLARLRDSARAGTGKIGDRMEIKDAKKKSWKLAWEIMSFGQVVNVLFGEDSAAARWFNAREISASNALEDAMQVKAHALESLLETLAGSRFAGEKLRHRMQTDESIKVTDALGNQHTFTEAEATTFLLMWRQDDGARHMRGITDDSGTVVSTWAWNESAAAEVERQLSPAGKQVLAFLGASYGEEYDRINDVFRRIWHVAMPRHKMYAPITVKATQAKADTIMDPVSGDTMGIGMTPGSLKNRSQSAVAEPDFRDAFQVYLTHARQMEHFIAYGEFARDALAVINRRDTRNAIEAAGGEDALKTISRWVDYFAMGGIRDANMGSAWMQALGRSLGRLSQAALVGRVSVLAMQSLQLAAAAYKMPLGAFLTRFVKLQTGMLGWGDAIRSPYIQRRLAEMPPVVRDAIRGLEAGSPNRLKFLAAKAGRTIAGADALFTAGTYAIFYDYHLKQNGGDEAAAHAEAERLTDQVAQPTRSGARSMIELANSGNPAFRALWNFSSDPRQKFSLIVYELMRRDKSRWDKGLAAGKAIAITWAVSGILQAVLRAVLRDVRSDDDDEVFDERHWNLKRLALQALFGPLGAAPIWGDMFESAGYKLTGQYLPQGSILSAPADAFGLIPKWMKGDIDPTEDAEKLFTGGAAFSGTSASAASASHLLRDAVNITENFIPD